MRAAGFNVTLQEFKADIFFEQADAVFARIAPDATTYERFDGIDGVWYTADFSGDGDVTADLRPDPILDQWNRQGSVKEGEGLQGPPQDALVRQS
jgi:hypothetical protein